MKLLIGFSLIIFGLFGVSAIPTQAQQTKAPANHLRARSRPAADDDGPIFADPIAGGHFKTFLPGPASAGQTH